MNPRDLAALRERLLALDSADRRALLRRLGPSTCARIRQAWPFWARPEQRPPPGAWRFWLVMAGRGFGKTRTGSEWIHERVRSGAARYIALAARDAGDARDVMVLGPAGILATSDPRGRPTFEPSKRRVTWPGGATATIFSSDDPNAARGPQHDTAWIEELAAWKPSTRDELFANLDLGLRLTAPDGSPPRAIVTTTPRPIDTLRLLRAAPSTVTTTGSSYANRDNLDPSFFSKLVETYEGTRLGRQEIEAELLDDVDGAMWTSPMIDAVRVKSPPELSRVVVSVDPAATSSTHSDETGIVVVGLGVDGNAYVLDDLSCRLPPRGWAQRAVDAYEEHRADCIVAEVNNGGEMVSETIASVSPLAHVRTVRAAQGKRARAEPVSALYERTPHREPRVFHVGSFRALEKQLTSFTGLAGERSPDRLDALVWAVHELLLASEMAFV